MVIRHFAFVSAFESSVSAADIRFYFVYIFSILYLAGHVL